VEKAKENRKELYRGKRGSGVCGGGGGGCCGWGGCLCVCGGVEDETLL